MSTLDSFDAMLAAASTKGLLNRFIIDSSTTSTAANSTSGRVTIVRFPAPITLPTVGAGVTGAYVTQLTMANTVSGTVLWGGLEYTLGTLSVSGNSFASGVAMPTKTVMGTAVTTAAVEPLLVVTTTLAGATTPVVTITYTDQAGNAGNTASLTLPNSPSVGSAFRIAPYLANGDTGIRAVTNISISTGTGGVLVVYGLLPINANYTSTAGGFGALSPLETPTPMYLWEAGERIAFYRAGSTTAANIFVHLTAVAET